MQGIKLKKKKNRQLQVTRNEDKAFRSEFLF